LIGHQSVSAFIYAVGIIPLMIIIAGPAHMVEKVLAIASIVMTLSAVCWILYLISYNRLSPLINRVRPETEEVWVRVTKSNMLSFQVVKKGVYGQTKGVMQGKKADVIDKGDFTVNLINGNKAILVHDMMSHNINLKHAIGWKRIFKKNKVSSGEDAYQKSKKVLKFRKKPKEVVT